jgi:hypothetical protein
MLLFKELYGPPYHMPLSLSESGERVIFGSNIVTEAKEKVKQIRANILTAQSHQKSYTDKRCRPVKFEVGDCVYLRISSMKGVHRFVIKENLVPRYIGLYPIMKRYEPLVYGVKLSPRLSGIHIVFH